MMLNLRIFCQNGANGIANSEDPDQTALVEEQSDLGLHCLPRLICPKNLGHYSSTGSTVVAQTHLSKKP